MRDNAGYNRLVGTTLFVLKWELEIISLSIFVHNALSLSEVSSIKKLHFFIYGHITIISYVPKHENLYFEQGRAATHASV